MKKERRLGVFVRKVLRRLFGPNREGECNKGLYNLRDGGKSLNSRSPMYIMGMMESWKLGSA
jgi:hypothetical protein